MFIFSFVAQIVFCLIDDAKLRRISPHSKLFSIFRSHLLRHENHIATNSPHRLKICRTFDRFDEFDTFISNFLTRTVRARYA